MASIFSRLKKVVVKVAQSFANDAWWPLWSNVRWTNERAAGSSKVNAEDKVRNITEARALVRKLYSRFQWTKDGADQLWDSICPPPYNYDRYKKGILKDDCDGFHSLAYHCIYNSGFKNTYLLSVVTGLSGGHCVLLFKMGSYWYVNDYDVIYGGYTSAKKAVSAYNAIYENKYRPKEKVNFNSTISYNYSKKKFEKAKNVI